VYVIGPLCRGSFLPSGRLALVAPSLLLVLGLLPVLPLLLLLLLPFPVSFPWDLDLIPLGGLLEISSSFLPASFTVGTALT